MENTLQFIIKQSFYLENDSMEYITKIIKQNKQFAGLFFKFFFLMSPSSKAKFYNIASLSTVISKVIPFIIGGKELNKGERKSMRKAHRKFVVNEKEYNFMNLAFKQVILSITYNTNKFGNTDTMFDYIDMRFEKLQHLIVLLNMEETDSDSGK